MNEQVIFLQCSTAIGVALLLPFLGVSSLNFGPLVTVAFFLRWPVLARVTGDLQVDFRLIASGLCLMMRRHVSITALSLSLSGNRQNGNSILLISTGGSRLFLPPEERCDQAPASAGFLTLKVHHRLFVLSFWFLSDLIRGIDRCQSRGWTGLVVPNPSLFCGREHLNPTRKVAPALVANVILEAGPDAMLLVEDNLMHDLHDEEASFRGCDVHAPDHALKKLFIGPGEWK
ncbi:hypothetical protein AA309_31185 [Microvirga vignae]|uniref:Uncharacterized protein n=1 Tax=Microvirga vignae TaxID=1225564 RepID=A0A0H1R2P7_9HYPH|nr:hypothetical protein AA309_31185 [Microvirga vignae]